MVSYDFHGNKLKNQKVYNLNHPFQWNCAGTPVSGNPGWERGYWNFGSGGKRVAVAYTNRFGQTTSVDVDLPKAKPGETISTNAELKVQHSALLFCDLDGQPFPDLDKLQVFFGPAGLPANQIASPTKTAKLERVDREYVMPLIKNGDPAAFSAYVRYQLEINGKKAIHFAEYNVLKSGFFNPLPPNAGAVKAIIMVPTAKWVPFFMQEFMGEPLSEEKALAAVAKTGFVWSLERNPPLE